MVTSLTGQPGEENKVIVMVISYLNVLAIADLPEDTKLLVGDRVSGDVPHRSTRKEGKHGNSS